MRTTMTIILTIGLACLARADQYDLTWNTVDGGGATGSSGGNYVVSGTLGQWDAGAAMSGGVYVVTGGFWQAEPPAPCPGDLTGDRTVDLSDVAILLGHYGQSGVSPNQGDLNGDTNVDLSDLAIILSDYGHSCP